MRRWFIAKARDAINKGAQGFTMYTVAEVVGHKKGEFGLSITSPVRERGDDRAKAACVRTVKLPVGGHKQMTALGQGYQYEFMA